MARIITVYVNTPRSSDYQLGKWVPSDMSYIRWFKISQALADQGHQVDIAVPDGTGKWPVDSGLSGRNAPSLKELSSVHWERYDMVKTLFHRGFETLLAHGGSEHPFIISKLGSVVGPQDMPGIYFYGDIRASLYSTQQKIAAASRFVAVLSTSAGDLWSRCHGGSDRLLLVPGGVDREIPAAGNNPYPQTGEKICIFAGHIYTRDTQPEANKVLCSKLNRLGGLLRRLGIRLYLMGSGDISALDREKVHYLGVVPYTQSWNYLYHADTGIVVSAGEFMDNNESSKIYHYLRTGLPTITESGFPNNHLVDDTGLGFITQSGDLSLMAEKIAIATTKPWNTDPAISHILDRHTWHHRAQIYCDAISADLPGREAG